MDSMRFFTSASSTKKLCCEDDDDDEAFGADWAGSVSVADIVIVIVNCRVGFCFLPPFDRQSRYMRGPNEIEVQTVPKNNIDVMSAQSAARRTVFNDDDNKNDNDDSNNNQNTTFLLHILLPTTTIDQVGPDDSSSVRSTLAQEGRGGTGSKGAKSTRHSCPNENAQAESIHPSTKEHEATPPCRKRFNHKSIPRSTVINVMAIL